jgi:cardiolipin synthase
MSITVYREWPWLVVLLSTIVALLASGHAILRKRDPRAAIAWVGLIWLAPLIGALLYLIFGINRVERRARRLRRRRPRMQDDSENIPEAPPTEAISSISPHLISLVRLVGGLTGQRLDDGNKVQPLRNGDETYPAMLSAIAQARESVGLCTYIFDNDSVGREFVNALAAAVDRGAEVRVLLDDVGIHYSWPTIWSALRKARIRAARFLPKLLPWYSPYANLCLHRKILVVDGRIGFTGGMNIRAGHDPRKNPRNPIQDLHFQLEGPVVHQLRRVFASDWHWTTGEVLRGPHWFPRLSRVGPTLARGIASGPDDDFEKIRMTLVGALSCAREHVQVVTPYFLPDSALIAALNAAALRGVQVDIFIPERNNLRLVQWACQAQLWQVLEHGCRVWLIPPPFDHSKLVLVDNEWALIGSANWDTRSLRLNFEFNVECYDRALCQQLRTLVDDRLQRAKRVDPHELEERSLTVKLRDGLAWLLSPYL